MAGPSPSRNNPLAAGVAGPKSRRGPSVLYHKSVAKFIGLGIRAPAALMPALGGPAQVVAYRRIGSSLRHPSLGTGRRGRDFRHEPRSRTLVDEAQQIQVLHRGYGPELDHAPAAVVHLRDRKGAVAVDRLHVGDVAHRRPGGDALHHDGAHLGHLALGEAVLTALVPPLPGVAAPRHGTLVGDPPRAVPPGEVVGTAIDGAVVDHGLVAEGHRTR